MSKSSVAWAVAGLLCACGGSSSSPDAGVDAPSVATRTVTGHQILHLGTPSGITDLPNDLSHATVAVMVPPDFKTIYGYGGADGTFSVPDVPVGEYYFVAGTHYFVASGDTLDLDFNLVGRADATFVSSPTNLTFNVTGMTAWQDGDEIEIYSPQSGTLGFDLEAYATTGAPAPSDTSLNGMVYDLRYASRNTAPSASAGDFVTVAHLSKATDGTHSYTAMAEMFRPAGLNVTNGSSNTITDAFMPVTTTQTLTATWDRPAFAADLEAHFPHSDTQNWSTFAITALQRAGTLGYYDSGPDLLFFAPGYTTDSSAVTTSWTYADPFPADWGRILWNRYYRYRFISLPGAQPTAVRAQIRTYRDLSTVAADPMFEPGAGVVVNPKINGSDALALAAMTGIGVTPTLSWDPPAIGTASKYYVTVYSVLNVSGTTTLKQLALLETPDTQLQIPPSVLAAGQPYVFEIGLRATSADLVNHPFANALPDAWASITTTMATP
jgi:hypothetical protein